jgi:hypothetical protein
LRGRRGARGALLAVGVVVAVNLVVLVVAGAGANQGPPSSSYATSPPGVAAYAELLAELGHPVARLRDDPEEADLSAADMLVVLDPPSLSPPAARRIGRFLRRGGTLVAGGTRPRSWLAGILARPPLWSPAGLTSAEVIAPLPEVVGAEEVAASGSGAWEDPGGGIAAIGRRDRALVVVASVGAGRAVLVADTSLLHNENLDRADNARLAASLAGGPGERVAFLESIHGYTSARGLAALPARWRWTLGGLVAAALVGMAGRARRLGPPDPAAGRVGPRRGDHVAALADLLARADRPEEALAPLRAARRAELAARAGLPPDAPDDAIVSAAAARGVAAEDARALVAEVRGEQDVLALGRAAAVLAAAQAPTR